MRIGLNDLQMMISISIVTIKNAPDNPQLWKRTNCGKKLWKILWL